MFSVNADLIVQFVAYNRVTCKHTHTHIHTNMKACNFWISVCTRLHASFNLHVGEYPLRCSSEGQISTVRSLYCSLFLSLFLSFFLFLTSIGDSSKFLGNIINTMIPFSFFVSHTIVSLFV